MPDKKATLAAAERRAEEAERQLQLLRDRYEAHAAQLEAVFDAITDGIYVYDRDGHLLRRNPAAHLTNPLLGHAEYLERAFEERITAFDVRDEAGKLLEPRDMPISRVLRGGVLTGDNAVDTSMRLLDGRVRRLNTTGAPVRDAEGQILGAVIVTRDVTERRKLERRTQDVLAALLAMAEALVKDPEAPDARPTAPGEPGCETESHGDEGSERGHAVARRLAELTRSVLGCSRVAILGVDVETRLQRPIAVVGLTPEQEHQWWDEQVQHPMRLGAGVPTDDSARFLAGEIIVLDMTQPPYSAIPNPFDVRTVLVAPMRIGEQIVGVLSLDHSGADHVYTADELRLAEAVARLAALVVERERLLGERSAADARVLALEEINRRMNEFLGIAGHEMRTPLTSAKANVQLAERQLRRLLDALDNVPDRMASAVSLRRVLMLFERTEQQMNRQQRLIDDLLDATRIQSGKLEMSPRAQDVTGLVQDAIHEQRLLHPGRVIAVHLPSASGPLTALVDGDRVGQVLTNYLTNALKYSPQDRPVTVNLSVGSGVIRIAVRDAGPGIPAGEHALIWEPFHRAPGVEVQSGSGVGLGLGLHISKTIVERHGGAVGVESRPGEGAIFWFTLPLAPPNAS